MAESKKTCVERLFTDHGPALHAFLAAGSAKPRMPPSSRKKSMCACCAIPDMSAVRNPEAYLYAVASNLAKEHGRRSAPGSKVIDIDEPTVQAQLAQLPTYGGEIDREQRIKRLHEVLISCRRNVARQSCCSIGMV